VGVGFLVTRMLAGVDTSAEFQLGHLRVCRAPPPAPVTGDVTDGHTAAADGADAGRVSGPTRAAINAQLKKHLKHFKGQHRFHNFQVR
jgi:hypothetical protein